MIPHPDFRVSWLPTTGSTHSEMLRRARRGEPAGFVLVADEQTDGRGRQGRAWESQPGCGLTFSVLRRPSVAAADGPRWTLLAGLSVLAAVKPRLPAPGPWLKWPNDVLIGERKLCGILCEMVCEGDGLAAIVASVGLNVHMPQDGWPPDLAWRATSMEEAGALLEPGARPELLREILASLQALEAEFVDGGPGGLLSLSREAMAPMFGRRARVEIGGSFQDVEVRGLRDNGSLEVVDGSGVVRHLLAGDVHFVQGWTPCCS